MIRAIETNGENHPKGTRAFGEKGALISKNHLGRPSKLHERVRTSRRWNQQLESVAGLLAKGRFEWFAPVLKCLQPRSRCVRFRKRSKRVHNWRVSLSLSVCSLSQGSETPFSQNVLVVASGVLLFLKFSVPFRAVPPVLFLQRSSSKPHSSFRAICSFLSNALVNSSPLRVGS